MANKNFFDFMDHASKNPTVGIRFLAETNTLNKLKALFKECGITEIPTDTDCKKLLAAKKDLIDNIDSVEKRVTARDKY